MRKRKKKDFVLQQELKSSNRRTALFFAGVCSLAGSIGAAYCETWFARANSPPSPPPAKSHCVLITALGGSYLSAVLYWVLEWAQSLQCKWLLFTGLIVSKRFIA